MKQFLSTIFLAFTINTLFGQLNFINNTKYKLYIAFAYYNEYSNWSGWTSKGWYAIEPGEKLKAFSMADINFNQNLGTTVYYCVSGVEDNIWESKSAAYFAVDKKKGFEIDNANKKSVLDKNSNYIWKKFHKIDASVKLLQFTVNEYINEIQGCPEGDCENGTGTYIWVYAGRKYEGQWVNGARTGQGKCTYYANHASFPNCTFEGKWRENDWIEGTLRYANGQKYVGEFYKNKPHGKGTLYGVDDKILKTGKWELGEIIYTENNAQPNTGSQEIHSEKPKIWAVIVGISDYPGVKNDLGYCHIDAQKVYDYLRSPSGGGVPSSQIIKLTNSNATRTNILSNCNQLFGKSGENDLIFFYFSGHGNIHNSFVAVDEPLSHTDLKQVINKSKARKKYCVADACFAGAWDKSYKEIVKTSPNDYYNILANSGDGLALFMSAKRDETSIEDNRLGHGVFTYFYLKGLSGEADNNFDDVITIHELYKYVEKNVSTWTWKNNNGHSQHPELHGKFDVSMPVGIISK